MNTIIRKEIAPGVYFSNVQDSRFKTMKITAVAMLPLKKDTVAAYALLSQVLTRSCKEYPDFTTLSKKLSSLYGASLAGGVQKIGESQALTFSVSGIDDRYALTDESISEDLSSILCKVLFEPLLIGQIFDENEVEQERRQLVEFADSELSDKRVYAGNRLLEVMCSSEPYGLRKYGSVDMINEVTSEDLYKAWQQMLKGATFEIIYVGDSSSATAQRVFTQQFASVEREPLYLSTARVDKAQSVLEHTETMEVSQAKLMMGYRTACAGEDEGVTAMRLMTTILGGSAHSKFFINVREKQSLCYYCAARYQRVKGILTVESGVEFENIDKTRKAIEAELEAMKCGEITEDEITFAKLTIANSFVSICDNVDGIAGWYISQLGDGKLLSVEDAISDFNGVTKEQIVEAANKLTLDTVYVLKGQ